MKNNVSVYIPTPCHENWQNMTPADKGRFCQSCAKQVVDFTMMTDNEVLNYFKKATGPTCGRFMNDQLQRPLQPVKQDKKKAWWIAAMMPLLLFFKKVDAQEKSIDSTVNVIKLDEQVSGMVDLVVVNKVSTDYWNVPDEGDYTPPDYTPLPKKPEFAATITVAKDIADGKYHVAGKIMSKQSNSPVVFAMVTVKGTKIGTLSDMSGNFKITTDIPGKEIILNVGSVGFSEAEVLVKVKDSIADGKPKQHNIIGVVANEKTNNPLPFATVRLKGTALIVAADANGYYNIKFSSTKAQPVLVFSSAGTKEKEVLIPAQERGHVKMDTVFLEEDTMILTDIVVASFSLTHDFRTLGYTVCAGKVKKADTVTTTLRKVFNINTFKAYPNPAPRGCNITIEIKKEGSYTIQLFDNVEHLINVKQINALKGSMQAIMSIPSQLNAGIYYIRLIDKKTKKQYTDKIVVM